MEHAEPEVDDGIAELFDDGGREEVVPRPLGQVLVAVLGTVVVLAVLTVAVVVAAPGLSDLVTGIAKAAVAAGSRS